MSKVIAMVNQKGGVAKTTSSINLCAYLADLGKKTLLIDCDPQSNATSGLGIDRKDLQYSIYDVLVNGISPDEVVSHTEFKGLDILPSTISLAGAEIELVSVVARETRLKRALRGFRDSYDFIIIDCPPSLGLLTLNALTVADSMVIPLQCEYYALEGLSQLMNTFELVKRHLNPDLRLEGILLTMFDPRTNLSLQVAEEARSYFGDAVFSSIIPRSVRLSEAPSHGLPILYYDPKSKGAEQYCRLAQELIERNS